jgi:hypothetical protein
MPAQFVPAVKTHRVCAQQPFHPLNQICSRRLHHQMKMIAHQTVGVHLPAALLAGGAQGREKALSIQMVPKNLFTPIRPGSSDDR